MRMGKVRAWAANILLGVLGNALYAAIASGGVLAVLVGLVAYFTSHPIWLERGGLRL
jgi:hypothetical protein